MNASMGSGRGDRNQRYYFPAIVSGAGLQWGPVVVTGISRVLLVGAPDPRLHASMGSGRGDRNQNTIYGCRGNDVEASMGSGRGDRNQPTPNGVGLEVWTLQWGPVVVTGIS